MSQLIAGWSEAAAPPPELRVSEWADTYRVLPTKSAVRGARWVTARVPYMRGPMDAIHEPGVKRIIWQKGAQIAGSEALHNIIGYHMKQAPCAMLLIHPTSDVAEKWSKERLNDMLLTTSDLAGVVDETKSTLDYKEFLNGFLVMGGANTPNSFARWSVRLALGDDVDRWPAVVGEEGDPADLLENRTTTFDDAIVMMVSTPILVDGRIDAAYKSSDQRRYFVACPSCGREDWITWSDPNRFHVVFDGHDADSARIECPSLDHGGCGAQMFEGERRAMIALGVWRPTAVPAEPGTVGFHIPSMLSTFSSVTLKTLVYKFLAAKRKGKDSMRAFINTQLAEGWEDRGVKQDPQALIHRRVDFGADVEVPAWAVAITAGVDVQENRVEIQVQAWGRAEERAVINYTVIDGDPQLPETWAAVSKELSRRYTHACGAQLPIHATCVDSGYLADKVYDFVLANQYRKVYATKGVKGKSGEPIVGKPSEKRRGKGTGEKGVGHRPVRLYFINTDDAKSNIMTALSQPTPGPGSIHFPNHLDLINEEYFAQLCAEHKETVRNRAKVATHTVWVQDRERNEALDTAVLCLAALRLLNPNIRQMLEQLPKAQALAVKAAVTAATPGQPAVKKPAERQVSRSSYLSR